jgi:homoserine O-acetyltransferase
MIPRTKSEACHSVATRFLTLHDEQHPLVLECGATLSPVTVAYETYGTLNSEGTNAVLICHALTANAHAAGYHSPSDKTPGWWDGLIGPQRAFDTTEYFVICPNILGSCYGTTGPASINPATGEPYRLSFPAFTVRDMVALEKSLLDALGVNRLAAVCGSSLGGMQVLEWGVSFPEFCERRTTAPWTGTRTHDRHAFLSQSGGIRAALWTRPAAAGRRQIRGLELVSD